MLKVKGDEDLSHASARIMQSPIPFQDFNGCLATVEILSAFRGLGMFAAAGRREHPKMIRSPFRRAIFRAGRGQGGWLFPDRA